MSVMTITEFLLARIVEDEAAATAAQSAASMAYFGDTVADAMLGLAASEGADRVAVEHFRRHNPDRVLAECEAKRRIVRKHRERPGVTGADSAPPDRCSTCRSHRWPCGTLRELASVYADHPDYDPAWRP